MIIRVDKNKDYTTICNKGLKNKNLSWAAKGLLAYLLSLPDDWKIYLKHLQTVSKDGKDSTKNKLKELEEAGYLVKGDEIKEDGKFKGFEYTVYESPKRVFRDGLSATENPPLLNTNILNTKELINISSLDKSKQDNISKLKQSLEDKIKDKRPKYNTLTYNEADNYTKKLLNEFSEAYKKIHPKSNLKSVMNPKSIYIASEFIKDQLNGLKEKKYGKIFVGDFCKKNNIPKEKLKKGFTKSEHHKLFKTALKVYEIGYWPFDKTKLPNNLASFLYNERTSTVSYLIHYGLFPPKYDPDMVKKIEDKYPKITAKIKKEVFQNKTWTISEENLLIKGLRAWINKIQTICNEKIKAEYENKYYTRVEMDYVLNKEFGTPDRFIYNFILFIHNTKEIWEKFQENVKIFESDFWWDKFVGWAEEELNINLVRCNMKYLRDFYQRQLQKENKIIIPEKSIEEKISEIKMRIKSATVGSFNYNRLIEEKNKLEKIFEKTA